MNLSKFILISCLSKNLSYMIDLNYHPIKLNCISLTISVVNKHFLIFHLNDLSLDLIFCRIDFDDILQK